MLQNSTKDNGYNSYSTYIIYLILYLSYLIIKGIIRFLDLLFLLLQISNFTSYIFNLNLGCLIFLISSACVTLNLTKFNLLCFYFTHQCKYLIWNFHHAWPRPFHFLVATFTNLSMCLDRLPYFNNSISLFKMYCF